MKKIVTIGLIAVMAAVMALSAGCGAKITTVTMKIRLYTAATTYDTYEMKLDLYEHLAPDTAKAFKEWVEDGVYDNMVFYKTDLYSSQVMVGDLKWVDGKLEQIAPQTFADAEFAANGTVGSNLTNVSGSFGLWKNFDREAGYVSSGHRNTVSTIYMPTSTISAYDGYFCVLGQYSDDEASVDAMTEIKDVLNGEDVQIYVQFCMKDSDTVLFLPEEEFDAIKEDRIDEDTVMKITVPDFMCYIESMEF